MRHVAQLSFREIQRLSRLMTVIWQSAIPPTLCTIFLCVLYVQFATAQKVCSLLYPLHVILVPFFLSCVSWTDADDLALHMQKTPQFWYPLLQAMIGKLYVLSLYYMM